MHWDGSRKPMLIMIRLSVYICSKCRTCSQIHSKFMTNTSFNAKFNKMAFYKWTWYLKPHNFLNRIFHPLQFRIMHVSNKASNAKFCLYTRDNIYHSQKIHTFLLERFQTEVAIWNCMPFYNTREENSDIDVSCYSTLDWMASLESWSQNSKITAIGANK